MNEQLSINSNADPVSPTKTLTLGETIAQLSHRDLVSPLTEHPLPTALAPVHDAENSPWYVKLMVGISAWIAASFLGIFFGAAGLIDTWQSMFIWGGLLGGGALGLKRLLGSSIFWGQLAFALILAGQGLILVGMADLFDSSTTVALALIGLEALIFLLFPDILHRMISLLAILGATVFLLYDQELIKLLHGLIFLCGLGTVLVWQAELRFLASRFHPFRVPLAYGFALAVLGLCLLPFTGLAEIARWWPSTAGLALVLLYLAHQVLREQKIALASAVDLWASGVLLLLLIPAYDTPGILAAMIVLLLGRWRSNGLLTGLAAIFLLAFLSIYYYNLDLPLLEKSYILMGLGVVLLAARFGLRQVVGQDDKVTR